MERGALACGLGCPRRSLPGVSNLTRAVGMKIKSVLNLVQKVFRSFARRVEPPVAEIDTACQKPTQGTASAAEASAAPPRQLDVHAATHPDTTADGHQLMDCRGKGGNPFPDQGSEPAKPRATSHGWHDLEARCAMPADQSGAAVPETGNGNEKRLRQGQRKRRAGG